MAAADLLHYKRYNPFDHVHPAVNPSTAMLREEAAERVICCLQRAEYVSVLAPPQAGKTTFLYQLRDRLASCVYIALDHSFYEDSEELTYHFCLRVRERFPELDPKSQDGTHVVRFLRELQDSRRIVFLVDGLPLPRHVAADFLQQIRAYYMESLVDGAENMHRFVIATSTDLIELTLEQHPLVSPFNIGYKLHLEDFRSDQVQSFIKRIGQGRFSEQAIQVIIEYTNGQPFLVQFLCHHLFDFTSEEIEDKLSDLPMLLDEFGISDTVNVRNMVAQIWNSPATSAQETMEVLRAVLEGDRIPFTISHRIVRSLYFNGCIRNDRGFCAVRNPIYEAIFRKNFEVYTGFRQIHARAEIKARPRPRHYEDYLKKLTYFDGWILVSVLDGTKPVPYDAENNLYVLCEKRDYTVKVTISKSAGPPQVGGLKERLLIEDGDVPTDAIEFRVDLESFYDLGNDGEQSRRFPPHLQSNRETYTFQVRTQEKTEGPVQVFINVFQGVSLVKIVRLFIQVDGY